MFSKSRAKAIYKLVIPLFLEMFLASLLGTVDTLMIKNYSELSVASIGNANAVLSFLVVLFNICSVGVAIVTSQYIGASKKEESRLVLSQGIIFNLGLGLFIALIFIFFNVPLLKLANTPDNVINESSSYIMIVAFALPFQAMTNCLSANLKANSKPFYITIVSLCVNLLNVLLNYLLIYGVLGTEPLGYKGAAIATLSCHLVTFILAVILTKVVLKQRIFIFKLHKDIFKSIIKIGGPSAFESICYNIAQFIVVSQVNKLLTDVMNARNYINMILNYTVLLSGAFGSANSILVGYAVGKHDYEEAEKTTKLSLVLVYPVVMFVVMLINTLGFVIFPLITQNENILSIIYTVLPILFLLETGRCINLVYINALKSSGDTLYPVICAVFSMYLIAAFGSYFFTDVIHLGLIGIFLANGLDECFRAVLVIFRWKSKKWQNKSLVKKAEA